MYLTIFLSIIGLICLCGIILCVLGIIDERKYQRALKEVEEIPDEEIDVTEEEIEVEKKDDVYVSFPAINSRSPKSQYGAN